MMMSARICRSTTRSPLPTEVTASSPLQGSFRSPAPRSLAHAPHRLHPCLLRHKISIFESCHVYLSVLMMRKRQHETTEQSKWHVIQGPGSTASLLLASGATWGRSPYLFELQFAHMEKGDTNPCPTDLRRLWWISRAITHLKAFGKS